MNKEVKQIAAVAFPEYKGRKFRVDVKIPTSLESYWGEGSRNYFVFVELDTKKTFLVHSNHPAFEANQPSKLNPQHLPSNVVVVEHSIFCGKDSGITIHCKPEQLSMFASNGGNVPLIEEKI